MGFACSIWACSPHYLALISAYRVEPLHRAAVRGVLGRLNRRAPIKGASIASTPPVKVRSTSFEQALLLQ